MITKYNSESKLESWLTHGSEQHSLDTSTEHIKVITYDNYILLGQATALRFIEWCCLNPGGMIALPTGKTPEFFMKWVQFYLENWDQEQRNGLLGKAGICSKKPDMKSFEFVQLDEFFPIDSHHERSFRYFVEKYYIGGFGFDINKAMLFDTYNITESRRKIVGFGQNLEEIFPDGRIDLSLRIKHPSNKTEELQKRTIKMFDQLCEDYEERIRSKGGIGFFLGGIGPDGHIAFNVRGSSHHSHTRLTNINYETQAAAASDLGGIETVRKKAVVTIGLETITYNPSVVALIIAAGESKSQVIADAIEGKPALEYPASVLQKVPNARFYLTNGAASKLSERKKQLLVKRCVKDDATIDRLVIDGAIEQEMSLMEVVNQAKGTPQNEKWILAEQLSEKKLTQLAQESFNRLTNKIESGLHVPKNKRFMHTAPHHDDIELAYFPLLHHLVRSEFNDNHFVYCTSGFTAVTNDYVRVNLNNLSHFILSCRIGQKTGVSATLDSSRMWDDITGALNAIAQQSLEEQDMFIASRLARQLSGYLKTKDIDKIQQFVTEQAEILSRIDPGNREPEVIQIIKGWIREFEAELVWAHFGIGLDHVSHLQLKFYTGDIFVAYPDSKRDVEPITELLERIKPTVISLALDPEGSGPDTHFKVLVALAQAIEQYVEKHKDLNVRVWGYRNIWSKFHPSEVSMIVPVSLNSFAVLHAMFNNCFISQKSASFPSYEYEGTFSELAQKIWVNQHKDLITLMGREFFYDSPNPMMRRSYGALYLKDMSYHEFAEEIKFIGRMLDEKKGLKEI